MTDYKDINEVIGDIGTGKDLIQKHKDLIKNIKDSDRTNTRNLYFLFDDINRRIKELKDKGLYDHWFFLWEERNCCNCTTNDFLKEFEDSEIGWLEQLLKRDKIAKHELYQLRGLYSYVVDADNYNQYESMKKIKELIVIFKDIYKRMNVFVELQLVINESSKLLAENLKNKEN